MSLEIGKVIYDILSQDNDLTEKVDNKIFPIVANEGTTFPFVVYKRSGLVPQSSKDRIIHRLDSTVEVVVASDKYFESIDVANLVIKALHGKKLKYSENLNIQNIELIDASEDFIDDTFIQSLTFNIYSN